MRKDVVTGEMVPKRQLIRVVRNKEMEVSLDPTGKKPGRGAYVSIDVKVAQQAKQKRTFDKVFGVTLTDEFYDELIAYTDHQQARQALFADQND
ncbi:Nucleic-acid-binding protein implicated in transcription termination [Limosilactobacillus equigenerosi DSM 18793 = JCM 14505]|uniref:Nucleic-acid-binding protein implicated in transcription termination n=2 Tax=Limosilactobacillus TaxID=2742598 RepID=A0A0R1UF94_9LACO|nr:Nucleic-acid-binding protein implicated in transcription termination [Limosilactobacillus equigenerosi DSM 18793 = JCM 14505]